MSIEEKMKECHKKTALLKGGANRGALSMCLSAQSYIACYRQYQDAFFIDCKRQPNLVIKLSHHLSETPEK